MAKEIQYSRIATKLQNLKAAHPQDVSAKLWRETFKDLINGGEAMRLFETFAGALMLLEARNKTYLKWSDKANANNWTAKWVENVFQKYDILSKFGPTMVDGKALHPRTNYTRKVAPAIEVAPGRIEVPVPEGPLESVSFPDITALSDGQLNMLKMHIAAEEKRRAQNAKKAELRKVFDEMAKEEGFSLEDIMGIV